MGSTTRQSSFVCGRFPADVLPLRFNDQSGAITILVLWGMVLVLILLAATSFTTRTEVRIAHNAVASSRARHAAEAGTQLGLFRLLQRRAQGVAIFDGRPEEWQDGSTKVAISILDEAGKIDINQAPLEFLAGLFVAMGRKGEEAILVACRILERRGSGDTSCRQPADEPAARRTRPFAAPEELVQLPGVGDAIYTAIADSVTVASGASAIDPAVASRTALLAIPGTTTGLVDAYIAHREMWHDIVPAGDSSLLLPDSRYLMKTPARDFTIKAVSTTAEGARYRADLQVRLTGSAGHPYEILAWRTPPVGVAEARSDAPMKRGSIP
jgi:general secretion pathway protein K